MASIRCLWQRYKLKNLFRCTRDKKLMKRLYFVCSILFFTTFCRAMTPEQTKAIEEYESYAKQTSDVLDSCESLCADMQKSVMNICTVDKQLWYEKQMFSYNNWVNHASFSKDETKFIVAKDGGNGGGHAFVQEIGKVVTNRENCFEQQKNREIRIHLPDDVQYACFYKNETHIITAT